MVSVSPSRNGYTLAQLLSTREAVCNRLSPYAYDSYAFIHE